MICIYSKKSDSEVKFTSREHIIPSGIGGILQLPYGVVSDDVNNLFSKMELEFMRNSLISIPRYFLGPGKRGSLSTNKVTKSNIFLMLKYDENPQLGFIKLGMPHIISQLIVNNDGKSNFICDIQNGNYENQFNDFIKNISNHSKGFIFIKEDILKNYFIIGYYKNNIYFASTDECNYSKAKIIIDAIKNGKFIKSTDSTETTGKLKVNIRASYDFNVFERICAKIVFNFLCYSKGVDFVLKNEFDNIRNWILNGGCENQYVQVYDPTKLSSYSEHLKIDFPELSHKIILLNIGQIFVGIITFYGNQFSRIVNLCDPFYDSVIYDGLICDWRNRKETRLNDYKFGLY